MKKIVFIFFSIFIIATSNVSADQPVMNEAPRWAGGWGFQVRDVFRYSDELIYKNDELENPRDLDRRVNTTWLEGVYTWDRSRRITIKIPWVDKKRTSNVNGVTTKQHDRGLGDIIIGFPLRKYINYHSWTSNIGFTPNLRLPTGKTSGDYPLGDGSTDIGFSLSYGAESPKYLVSTDVYYWFNNEGTRQQNEGNKLGLDITLGKTIYYNSKKSSGASIQLDFGAHYKEEGFSISGNNPGTNILIGPAFVYFQGPMMLRLVHTIPVYEYALDTTISNGHRTDIGMGWSF